MKANKNTPEQTDTSVQNSTFAQSVCPPGAKEQANGLLAYIYMPIRLLACLQNG